MYYGGMQSVKPLQHLNDLNGLAEELWSNAKAKGFHDNPVPMGDLCANLHGEVSELWEAFRGNKLNKPCDKAGAMEQLGLEPLTCAEEELADILIRCLDTAREIGVDMKRAVLNKAAYNSTRPHKHGGKLA